MASGSPATFALLGLLASRSWTGYELTRQVQRSIRFTWPTSEAHLYREQKRLVTLGWASVEEEPVGERTRKRYAITPAGRAALREWLTTSPQEPQLHIEGILRAFHADQGAVDDLAASMRATAEAARAICGELRGFVAEYLEEGGPLSMLEAGTGGPDSRLEFHGRPMFPERLHAVALTLEMGIRLYASIDDLFEGLAAEIAEWPSTTDPAMTASTRRRLERLHAARDPAPQSVQGVSPPP
jgi:PadR family transcriptional regulator, regulatory protein AphA